MQQVSSGPDKAEVRRSIGSAEACVEYIGQAGALLRLCHKHDQYKGLRDEWPDDNESWEVAASAIGLSNPEGATISSVLNNVYARGLNITYLATIDTPDWIYDGFELMMSLGGPACRFVVHCAKTGAVKSAAVEWQHWSTHWTRMNTKIRSDALRCLSLVGYGAAHKWPYAAHSLSGKRFRARYQPRTGE